MIWRQKVDLMILAILANGAGKCDSIDCDNNDRFSGAPCPLKGLCTDTMDKSEFSKRVIEIEYNNSGTNDIETPVWLSFAVNRGIHVAVKWNKDGKTLYGKCVAVIDGLAVVVSKKDPSKVITVAIDRISEDV